MFSYETKYCIISIGYTHTNILKYRDIDIRGTIHLNHYLFIIIIYK